jgi:hypothetical protein
LAFDGDLVQSRAVPRGPYTDLVDHLTRTTPLSAGEAARVVDEVVAYFGEPVGAFVRRRHAELQRGGHTNDQIFTRLGAELATRRFAPPELSTRQLRRIVYG